jgi:hypothetical protein
MKTLALICRILVGIAFVFFGANIVHPFLPMPALPPDAPIAKFNMVMMASGWMTAIGVVQVLGGLLMLYGGTVPLALCLLCPVTFNILCCHLCLMGGAGIGPGAAVTVLELILIYAYRNSFAGILTASAQPQN